MEKIHQYDIIVQTEKKEVFHTLKFVCGYFYWLENNICQKYQTLLAQKMGEKKSCQNSLKLRLKKKNVAWTTNLLAGGGAKPL